MEKIRNIRRHAPGNRLDILHKKYLEIKPTTTLAILTVVTVSCISWSYMIGDNNSTMHILQGNRPIGYKIGSWNCKRIDKCGWNNQ